MLEIGMKGSSAVAVTTANTANAFSSGTLEVFATPAMIALMEETCWKLVQPELEEGQSTVGTKVEIEHLAPSPVGNIVQCKAELIEIDRRRLVFTVICTDGERIVGRGTHERFIINNTKFMEKAVSKV